MRAKPTETVNGFTVRVEPFRVSHRGPKTRVTCTDYLDVYQLEPQGFARVVTTP